MPFYGLEFSLDHSRSLATDPSRQTLHYHPLICNDINWTCDSRHKHQTLLFIIINKNTVI